MPRTRARERESGRERELVCERELVWPPTSDSSYEFCVHVCFCLFVILMTCHDSAAEQVKQVKEACLTAFVSSAAKQVKEACLAAFAEFSVDHSRIDLLQVLTCFVGFFAGGGNY